MAECLEVAVSYLSWALVLGGVAFLIHQLRWNHTKYGRYSESGVRTCPARLAWLLQEVPAFLLPLILLLTTAPEPSGTGTGTGWKLPLCAFMLHYFQRSFIYAFLMRGRPVPLPILLYAAIFCLLNGFLQGHHLLHCGPHDITWPPGARVAIGSLLFVVGMTINIHSDHILRNLRTPGETVYRLPQGGMFEYVSGANFFGEIVEWCGYAIATWTFPTFAFAFFTICSIAPRALHHHRDYQQRFEDYPHSRTAIIPFIL